MNTKLHCGLLVAIFDIFGDTFVIFVICTVKNEDGQR